MNSSVYVAHTVSVHEQAYRTGCVLPLTIDNNGELVFGETINIIPQADNVSILMFVRILTVKFFDEHLYAYVVQKTRKYEMINLTDAKDCRPLDIILSAD